MNHRPGGVRPPRIVAGRFRGRPLHFPSGVELRPTAENVRESLFNSLAYDLPGARFADLFAGTGAVGLEALSRGAAHVTFLEKNPRCLEALRTSVENLGVADQVTLVAGDVLTNWPRVTATGGQFDIVFADPPYAWDHWEPLLDLLLARGWGVAPDGLVILEHSRRQPPAPPLEPVRTKTFGETQLSWFEIAPPAEEATP
ncbi:MAG TPA: 16S rRNA (guanine(966)-N(2))-methyltransferase RsmD [Armatimonadota bacterium]|jgi:16S rRNA (guanine(966)-N(2))-methyltransferase RsmD